EARLFSESITTPLVLLALLLALDDEGRPTRRRAVWLGLVLGLLLLSRPSLVYLFLVPLVAWSAAVGWRPGVRMTALTTALAVLVVAPWTIRNYAEYHAFVPISWQDAAGVAGVLNPDSANDKARPYWVRP